MSGHGELIEHPDYRARYDHAIAIVRRFVAAYRVYDANAATLARQNAFDAAVKQLFALADGAQ